MGVLHRFENGYMLNAYSEHFTNPKKMFNELFWWINKKKTKPAYFALSISLEFFSAFLADNFNSNEWQIRMPSSCVCF